MSINQSPETTATTQKPLPEETRTTIGPGHLDMLDERITQVIGIAEALYAALSNPEDLQPGTEGACWAQKRLLEEAREHLAAYYHARAEEARQARIKSA